MSNKYIVISTDVDWRYISWEKPSKDGEVSYFSDLPFEGLPLYRKLIKLFYSWTINKKGVRVPFRGICYKGIVRAFHLNTEDHVKIIFYDRSRASYDFDFIQYLRDNISGVKIGYLFSDVVEKSGAKLFGIEDKLSRYYDKVFSFDRMDSARYGFDYSYLIYDRIIRPKHIQPEFDVFLVAKAKDRLPELIAAYDICAQCGLRIDFVINAIPLDQLDVVGGREIQTNKILPYNEVVERLRNSKCIVDVMQKESKGITLNIVEAVVYNIKAISNNSALMREPFYDKTRIFILTDTTAPEEIIDFLNTPMIPYSFDDRRIFSGVNLFERL